MELLFSFSLHCARKNCCCCCWCEPPLLLQDGGQQLDKKLIKKKKRDKTQEDDCMVNINLPVLQENEMNRQFVHVDDKNHNKKSTVIKTLSNGFTVEELATGEPDGKLAVPGKEDQSLLHWQAAKGELTDFSHKYWEISLEVSARL